MIPRLIAVDASRTLVIDVHPDTRRWVHERFLGVIDVGGGTLYPVDIPANICVRNALVDDCNWVLTTHTGQQAHFVSENELIEFLRKRVSHARQSEQQGRNE